jgi:hypothetical protein
LVASAASRPKTGNGVSRKPSPAEKHKQAMTTTRIIWRLKQVILYSLVVIEWPKKRIRAEKTTARIWSPEFQPVYVLTILNSFVIFYGRKYRDSRPEASLTDSYLFPNYFLKRVWPGAGGADREMEGMRECEAVVAGEVALPHSAKGAKDDSERQGPWIETKAFRRVSRGILVFTHRV